MLFMPGGSNMYNDDENINGTDLGSGAPSSENPDQAQNNTENSAANDIRQQIPSDKQPEVKETPPNPYYEPWQQPVYRGPNTSGQVPYTPGIHNGSFSAYQRYQPNEPQPEKKKRPGFSGFAKAVCLILVAAIVCGGVSYGVVRFSLDDLKASNHIALGDDDAQNESTPSAGISPTAGSPDAAANGTSTGTEMSAEDIY